MTPIVPKGETFVCVQAWTSSRASCARSCAGTWSTWRWRGRPCPPRARRATRADCRAPAAGSTSRRSRRTPTPTTTRTRLVTWLIFARSPFPVTRTLLRARAERFSHDWSNVPGNLSHFTRTDIDMDYFLAPVPMVVNLGNYPTFFITGNEGLDTLTLFLNIIKGKKTTSI